MSKTTLYRVACVYRMHLIRNALFTFFDRLYIHFIMKQKFREQIVHWWLIRNNNNLLAWRAKKQSKHCLVTLANKKSQALFFAQLHAFHHGYLSPCLLATTPHSFLAYLYFRSFSSSFKFICVNWPLLVRETT